MAFSLFDFTKSWRNAGDFPTFEPDETKVRDDLQSLFDELKAGLNRLIGELRADNMPFTPTAEVDSSDVQNAIENVQSQIAAAILGQLPDGSVTAQKLADGAVVTDKIEDSAVTAAKLAEGVLPLAAENAPLMDGTASAGESAAFARADHVHPKDGTKADLSGGRVLPTQLSKARVNVTASRALELTDDGKALYISGSSAVTVTIPANSTVQLPIGSEIILYRAGSGTVTVAAASGVTLRCSDELNGLGRYDTARLKKWEANVWSCEINHNGVDDGEVTNTKLADSAVGTSKLADESVTTSKVSSKAVTRDKLAADVLYSPIKEITGTSYTILADDLGKTLKFTSSSNVSVSFPGELFSSLANGAEFAILKWAGNDTSKVTVSVDSSHYIARSGTTVQGGNASISSRYSMAALKKVTAATLLVTGELD